MMNILSRDMIIPEFGEYNYYYETGTKAELTLFWVRDAVAVFKKETQLLIESGDIDIPNINRIDKLLVIIIVKEHFDF